MLRLAPWVRAPLLLLRRPGVALALAAAAFVATLPAAAGPLFMSSARNAALHHQIERGCQWTSGVRLSGDLAPVAGQPTAAVAAERLRAVTAAAPAGLTAPVHAMWMRGAATAGGTGLGPVYVMTRDDFAAHVTVLAGGTGPGLWLPDRFAAAWKLSVGDRITVTGNLTPTPTGKRLPPAGVTMAVAAIYLDLRGAAPDPYWCAHEGLYKGPPGAESGNQPIPPLILADERAWTTQVLAAPILTVQDADFALADPYLDVATARGLTDGWERMRAAVRADPLTSDLYGGSHLADYVSRTGLMRTSLVSPVLSITAAGVAVGLLVTAAAAVFWVRRRRTELAVLAAHGVGPAALGVKGLAEALPALVAGAAAGWSTAALLVRSAGPSPVITPDASPRSLLAAAVALVAAIVVVTVVAGVRTRSITDAVAGRRRLRAAAVPWEMALVAAGVYGWFRLDGSRVVTSDQLGAVALVPGRLLVVPMLVIVGCAALTGRIGAAWLRRRARRPAGARARRRPALFLASRRLSREAAVATLLAGATAVPTGLAVYGATVNGSVRATLVAEANFMVGADVVVTLDRRVGIPPALAGRATEVLRVPGVIVGPVETDVLIVDPETFARDAFWDERTIGMPLREAMDVVRAGGAVLGWPGVTGDQPVRHRGEQLPPLAVRGVDRLPAGQGGYPTMLVSRETAGGLADRGDHQLWVRGDPAEVTAAVAGLPVDMIATARTLYSDTVYEAVTYTFDYLSALSLLTGLITMVGLLLYLESRAPAHRRGYALMRRMRLRPGSHRAALAAELTAPLLAGLAGGVALAAASVLALGNGFEINPDLPPGTIVTVPYPALAMTAAAVAAITLLAVAYAQYRLGRATPGEVLREV